MSETVTAETVNTIDGLRAPMRTARVIGLGHKLPDRVVPNGPIAERIGVDSDVDRAPHRHPLAPLRGAPTSARPTSRSPPRAAPSPTPASRRPTSTSSSWRR